MTRPYGFRKLNRRSVSSVLQAVHEATSCKNNMGTVTIALCVAGIGINDGGSSAANPAAVPRPVQACQVADGRRPFPFTIEGDQFYQDGSPMFLHVLCYSPFEPGQHSWNPAAEISDQRIADDLRRFQAYRGGSGPILLRVYPQPEDGLPHRLPQCFYDGVRELGFWLIRDIYLPDNCSTDDAQDRINAVIAEAEAAGAMDLIFAWEFGNEYQPSGCPGLASFLDDMCEYLKSRLNDIDPQGEFSHWVTWASWHKCDPLHTDAGGIFVDVPCLDFYSYNSYSYDPERIRDHQGGKGTGTPFAGYLAALKEYVPGEKPLVVSETGLSDCPTPSGWEHPRLKPWYPAYRYGGLTSEQVAEGLADRYWDARLTGMAGLAFFEWNDEWWKCEGQDCPQGDPSVHDLSSPEAPEEYFGLLSFDKHEHNVPEKARFKLQHETVRDLFAMRFPVDPPGITLVPQHTTIPKDGSTTIHADISEATPPVRFRWESSRGRIVGDSGTVHFYAAGRALGPATITAIVIDAEGRANSASTIIDISTGDPPGIDLLTLGTGPVTAARASGHVTDVSLADYKVIVYIHTNAYYVQPFGNMKSIWVRADGYWWTPVNNYYDGDLATCLVPVSYEPPDVIQDWEWLPAEAIGCATLDGANDSDNDLLPDSWETLYFGTLDYDRYDDPDNDKADNLEEFLSGTDPTVPDNDTDSDGLPDTWELLYLGTLAYDADDDPDGDDLDNQIELTLEIHPGRAAADRDRDSLPDTWEMRWFSHLDQAADGDPNNDGFANLEAYDFGLSPVLTADFGGDGCVDLLDLGVFESCATGPAILYDPGSLPNRCGVPYESAGIIPPDLDRDSDTDQDDFGLLQRCFSGPDIHADPACLD